MNVRVEILDHYAGPDFVFWKSHPGKAGVDLYAATNAVLLPGQSAAIPVGLKVSIPEGYEIQIRPVNSPSGLTALYPPSTIDTTYKGELMVPLVNYRPAIDAEAAAIAQYALQEGSPPGMLASLADAIAQSLVRHTCCIYPGQKIAQMVFSKVVYPIPEIVTPASLSIPEDTPPTTLN